jgi:hypothetical protein
VITSTETIKYSLLYYLIPPILAVLGDKNGKFLERFLIPKKDNAINEMGRLEIQG